MCQVLAHTVMDLEASGETLLLKFKPRHYDEEMPEYTGHRFYAIAVFGLPYETTDRSFEAMFTSLSPPVIPDSISIKRDCERGTGIGGFAQFDSRDRRDDVLVRYGKDFERKFGRSFAPPRTHFRVSKSIIARLYQQMCQEVARFEREHFPMLLWPEPVADDDIEGKASPHFDDMLRCADEVHEDFERAKKLLRAGKDGSGKYVITFLKKKLKAKSPGVQRNGYAAQWFKVAKDQLNKDIRNWRTNMRKNVAGTIAAEEVAMARGQLSRKPELRSWIYNAFGATWLQIKSHAQHGGVAAFIYPRGR